MWQERRHPVSQELEFKYDPERGLIYWARGKHSDIFDVFTECGWGQWSTAGVPDEVADRQYRGKRLDLMSRQELILAVYRLLQELARLLRVGRTCEVGT